MTELSGRCLCGAVQVRVSGTPDAQPSACHCHICRTWSGGLFFCFCAEAERVEVTGEARSYPSSRFAERAFCPRCGTHLWVRDQEDGAGYDLMPGLFEDMKDAALHTEIYTDRAPAYAALAGDHPRITQAEYEERKPHLKGKLT